jgi:hypothetical protein
MAALQHVHAELTRSLRKCNRALKSHTAGDRCPILAEFQRGKPKGTAG